MVSTPELCNNNSPMTPNQYDPTKKPSARKLLHQFWEKLDVKHKTAVRRLCAAKENFKANRTDNTLWSNISKRNVHTKINQNFKEALYNWILHHPQVVKSTIANNFLYVSFDGNSEKQLIPNFFLQVYVR